MSVVRRALCALLAVSLFLPSSAFAWANGDNSGNGFGTHDWVLLEAYQLAGADGYGWLNISTALSASDDPDTVLHDTYHHVYDVWGSTYGDAPTHIDNVFGEIIAARDAGDLDTASILVGRLAHYYADICNPIHTDQTTEEEAIHSNYEDSVETLTDTQNENDSWVTSDGLSLVSGPGAVRNKAIAAATASHADYSALVSAYSAGNTSAHQTITRRSVNRAANDLADVINSLETGTDLGSWESFERVSGQSRFDTAIATAKKAFPGWAGVEHVVVASGDDKAMADPLAAASLCWAYDAPLLLTSGVATPAGLKTALREIEAANPGVQVHVIGGGIAVPASRMNDIAAIVGADDTERIAGANRFATAVEIAQISRTVGEARGKSVPSVALIANGYESSRFFDALALSTISASTGAPILLSVPRADGSSGYKLYLETTKAYVDQLSPSEVFVAGGTLAVSDAIAAQLGAEGNRLAGQSRYGTAVAVANKAISRGWLSARTIGVASKLPDALAGGTAMGRMGGVLLLNAPDRLSAETGTFMKSKKGTCTHGMVFGGTSCISSAAYNSLRACVDPDYVEPQTLTTLRVTISDASPSQYTDVYVYAKALDHNGNPISGASVTSTWRYKSVTQTESGTTGSDGVASMMRYISGAAVGYRVYVDVRVTYGGRTLTGQTSFVPH